MRRCRNYLLYQQRLGRVKRHTRKCTKTNFIENEPVCRTSNRDGRKGHWPAAFGSVSIGAKRHQGEDIVEKIEFCGYNATVANQRLSDTFQ
jgi:hypothetical protein